MPSDKVKRLEPNQPRTTTTHVHCSEELQCKFCRTQMAASSEQSTHYRFDICPPGGRMNNSRPQDLLNNLLHVHWKCLTAHQDLGTHSIFNLFDRQILSHGQCIKLQS